MVPVRNFRGGSDFFGAAETVSLQTVLRPRTRPDTEYCNHGADSLVLHMMPLGKFGSAQNLIQGGDHKTSLSLSLSLRPGSSEEWRANLRVSSMRRTADAAKVNLPSTGCRTRGAGV